MSDDGFAEPEEVTEWTGVDRGTKPGWCGVAMLASALAIVGLICLLVSSCQG